MPAEAPSGAKAGRGDRIRTCDPLLPKQMRYQAAPLPDLRPSGFGGQARQCPQTTRPRLGLPAECQGEGWWARRDSNPQPSRYERPALPLSYRPCRRFAVGCRARGAQGSRLGQQQLEPVLADAAGRRRRSGRGRAPAAARGWLGRGSRPGLADADDAVRIILLPSVKVGVLAGHGDRRPGRSATPAVRSATSSSEVAGAAMIEAGGALDGRRQIGAAGSSRTSPPAARRWSWAAKSRSSIAASSSCACSTISSARSRYGGLGGAEILAADDLGEADDGVERGLDLVDELAQRIGVAASRTGGVAPARRLPLGDAAIAGEAAARRARTPACR